MPITERQLELRRKHIGSSDSAAILGLSPHKNAADVYYEKVEGVNTSAGNAAIAGNYLEDSILTWAADRLGVAITRNQRRVSGVFAANCDALINDRPEGMEAKTSGLYNPRADLSAWGSDGSDEVPETVIIQCQHQMMVAELRTVWVPALTSKGLRLYRIERNERVIAAIKSAGEAFWKDYVEAQTPPPDTIPSTDILKEIKREPNSVTTVPDEVVQAWLEADAYAKAANKAKDAAKAQLIEALGTAEAGESSLARVTYMSISSKRLDTKRLKDEQPDVYAQYAKDSSYRILKVKEVKNG